jgi:hypothetical protein
MRLALTIPRGSCRCDKAPARRHMDFQGGGGAGAAACSSASRRGAASFAGDGDDGRQRPGDDAGEDQTDDKADRRPEDVGAMGGPT